MFGIPILTLFNAGAELIVAAVVLYAIISHLRGGRFPAQLLGAALLFELCIVIAYRFMQVAGVDTGLELTVAAQKLLTAQGFASLLTFLGLAILFVLAAADVNAGRRSWFQRNVAPAWTFVGLWLATVLSGEALFVYHYLV